MMPYIDLHCDTLTFAMSHNKNDIYRLDSAMADVERLKRAGAMAQFFAVFFPPENTIENALPKGLDQLGGDGADDISFFQLARAVLCGTIKRHSSDIAFAQSRKEMEKNFLEKKLSAFLTLEDGRAVDGKMDRLSWFYEQGVRLITLTWNCPNCFGYPNSRDLESMKKGLTEFGILAVGEMNRLGILVDVSHLSDGGFFDVAEHSRKPFVASHSNCRVLTPHPRNLTDEMIHTLAEHGGAAGLNLAIPFVRRAPEEKKSTVAALADHAMHLFYKGGEDLPAIGTDFDGIEGVLEIDEPGKMELFFEELSKRGLTESQIEKIAYKNVQRVLGSLD